MPATESSVALSFTTNFGFPEIERFGGLVECRTLHQFRAKVRYRWLGFVALEDSAGPRCRHPGGYAPIVGFGAICLAREVVTVKELIVDPARRRQGIGTAIVRKLIDRKLHEGRPHLAFNVPETNLPAQLWLRDLGIPCRGTIPGYFGSRTVQLEPRGIAQIPIDAYRFLHTLEAAR